MANVSNSNVLVPLSKQKKLAATAACILLLVGIAMTGAGFPVIQIPILTKMHAEKSFTLITLIATIATAVMNPVGTKLGDMMGKRSIIILAAILSLAATAFLAVTNSYIVFLIARTVLGLSQGAIVAAPYIIVREINEPAQVPKYMGILASGMAVGTLLSGFLTGILVDKQMYGFAIISYAIPVILAAILLALVFPNIKSPFNTKFDVPGAALIASFITSFLLALNFVGKIRSGEMSLAVTLLLFAVVCLKTQNTAACCWLAGWHISTMPRLSTTAPWPLQAFSMGPAPKRAPYKSRGRSLL